MEDMIKQTKSTNKCICPYCNVMFYVYPPPAHGQDKIIKCSSCKKEIKVTATVEFTCHTIKDQSKSTNPVVKENKCNDYDYGREMYLAGHRDAYRNFARKIF